MGRLILRRLIQTPILLVIIVSVVFFCLRLGPFSPSTLLEQAASQPQRVQALRKFWGVDDSAGAQYVRYLRHLATGDLGRSFQDNRKVSEIVGERLPATIELAMFALVLGGVVGVSLGVVSAMKRETLVDTGIRSVALLGVSIPAFWLGVMFIAVFAVRLGWLPAGGRLDSRAEFTPITGFYFLDGMVEGRWDIVVMVSRHLILPAGVLSLFIIGFLARVTRVSMIEVLGQEYVRAAVARGNPPWRVLVFHALPNALLPIVTIAGLLFGLLLGGSAVIETVFTYPGMGRLLVDAILVRDYPQIQASIVILAGIYIVINLVVDVLYAYIDPRIRTGDVSMG